MGARRFVPRQTKPLRLCLVTAVSALLYTMSSNHVNTNLNTIRKALGITSQQASWIMNIETIVQLVFTPVSGKLGERFGPTIVMTISTGMVFFFNMFFCFRRVSQNYYAVLVFRALAAAGMGVAIPLS